VIKMDFIDDMYVVNVFLWWWPHMCMVSLNVEFILVYKARFVKWFCKIIICEELSSGKPL